MGFDDIITHFLCLYVAWKDGGSNRRSFGL